MIDSMTSASARRRLLSVRGEPLLLSDWDRALFMHFEVDASALQAELPFTLDLREGKAYVSLVAFTMRRMRPRSGRSARNTHFVAVRRTRWRSSYWSVIPPLPDTLPRCGFFESGTRRGSNLPLIFPSGTIRCSVEQVPGRTLQSLSAQIIH